MQLDIPHKEGLYEENITIITTTINSISRL